jgi:hypothetical protein
MPPTVGDLQQFPLRPRELVLSFGYIGGTRFEIEYALKLGIPVQINWEHGTSQLIYQYPLRFMEQEHEFFLAWKEFFCKTNLEIEGKLSVAIDVE